MARHYAAQVDDEAFDAVLEEVLAGLPGDLRSALEGISIFVAESPEPGRPAYGLYQGPPALDQRSGELPGMITVFRRPLVRDFGADPARLRDEIRITLLHEIGHAFGIDEARLADLGYE